MVDSASLAKSACFTSSAARSVVHKLIPFACLSLTGVHQRRVTLFILFPFSAVHPRLCRNCHSALRLSGRAMLFHSIPVGFKDTDDRWVFFCVSAQQVTF